MYVKTVDMFGAFREIEIIDKTKLPDGGKMQSICKIIIEDPNLNGPTFFKEGVMSQAAMNKVSQNVGANKRDAALLIEKCKNLGFDVETIKPKKDKNKKKGKINHEEFVLKTKFDSRCSQHARDAAMLIFGR